MKIYKYSVAKSFIDPEDTLMYGKTINRYARGYVFAESEDNAMEKLKSRYVSNNNVHYHCCIIEQTSIIEM